MKLKLLRQLLMLSKYVAYGVFLQLFIAHLALAAGTNVQKDKLKDIVLTVDFSNQELVQIFDVLSAETDFNFIYNGATVDVNKKISVKSDRKPLYSILMDISKKADVQFKRVNASIYVKNRIGNETNVIDIIQSERQTRTITGKVTSFEDGSSMPGVNILEKGTNNGTVTDVDGNYTIQVGEGATLVFSSVGYTGEEVAVGNQSVINMQLTPDIQQLQELVVVGYGAVKKSDVTGSLSSISAEDIQSLPVQNVTQSLQGKAAGIDILTNNFRPGETPRIRIRGNRSLKASNDPLYVLDGIPLAAGSSIGDINPMDIESVEVLKDASATAIYGSRGANGVVLITTKKGQRGQTEISYDGYVGFEGPLVELDLFDGAGFAELRREAHRTTGEYATAYPDPVQDFALFGQDPYMWESVARAYQWTDRDNLIAATDGEGRPIYNPSAVRTTDWRDMVTQTGINQNHQLSISGGDDKMRILFSGGYLDHKGVVQGQSYNRYSARLNLDFNVNDWLRIGASNMASLSLQDYGADLYGKASGQLPLAVPYTPDGDYIRLPGGDDGIINPILDDELITNERRNVRYIGSFFAEVDLFEGLRYRVNFGPDFSRHRRGEFQAANSSNRDGSTSWAEYYQNERFSYVVENLLYYDKTIANNHELGVTLMQSIQQNRFEESEITASDLPYDTQKFYALETTYRGSADGFNSGFSESSLMSFMGRINYSLMNKYLFTLTGRYDGSSVLAEGNKWDFFPSLAFAWKMQEEPFLRTADFVSEMKFRLGYGQIGNSSIDPYETGGTLASTVYVWGENAAKGYAPNEIPTPLLGWEKTTTVNVGLDFGIFSDRVFGSIDWYRANTTDLLMERSLPTVSGYGHVNDNIGATRNTGVELALSTVNINSADGFRWETDLVFTKNNEEIVELYGSSENDDIPNSWFIGYPINSYYDLEFGGIWQTGEESDMQEFNDNGGSFVPGDIKIVDQDGNKTIEPDNDRTILGSSVPDWSGGITNRFSYKGFELSAFIYTRQGYLIRNRSLVPTLAGRYPDRKVDYWTAENSSNAYPRPNADKEFPTYWETLQYKDGSFVKVRNITLSYNFPQSILSRLNARNLNVYVMAVNPFLFTDFEVLDPEAIGDPFNNRSARNGLSTRSFVVGLRLGL